MVYRSMTWVVFVLLAGQQAQPDKVTSVGSAHEMALIPHPLTMLVRSAAVHTELGLSLDQIRTIEAAVDAVDLPLWRLRDVGSSQRLASAGPLLDQLRDKLSQSLSRKQMNRLNQIVLQAHGVHGLLDSQMAAKLALSKDQIAAIKRQLESSRGRIGDRRDVRTVLNGKQRRMWASMMGPAFDLGRVRQRACRAPELQPVEAWVNSGPVTFEAMRGKVVIVHFYAFGCINCVRNLPHYSQWQADFPPDQVCIIGIHRPETESERVVEEVRRRAEEAGLSHSIAVDNQSRNWDAWANQIWPSVYLIDKEGFVRYWWYGELNWQGAQGQRWMRARIEELLAET